MLINLFLECLVFLLLHQIQCIFAQNKNFTSNYTNPTLIYGNKLLGMILSFDLTHSDPIDVILFEYLSMCEGGWNVTIIFFTTEKWESELQTYIRRRTYCYRSKDSINIIFSVHPKSLGTSLAAAHRKELREYLPHYDLFIYHEDDIIFGFKHLVAYVEESQILKELIPASEWLDYSIGFLRFRRIMRKDMEIHNQAWGAADVIEQEMLEELPNLKPICLQNDPYIMVEGNTHQAMWILSREQIIGLDSKCGFLNQTSPSREYMSSLSIFHNFFMKQNCAVKKIIPAHRMQTFSIRHYYQGRHPQWSAVHISDQRLRKGFNYLTNAQLNMPLCWAELNATGYTTGALRF